MDDTAVMRSIIVRMLMTVLTQARLKELLNYDPGTGVFTWRIKRSNRINAGGSAGTTQLNGYIYISIDKRQHRAHRLAWLYVHGEWPLDQVDHINGIKNDNRLSNLRLATNALNRANSSRQSNNTSGFKGVSWDKYNKRWRAYIVRKYLGLFNTAEEAHDAYCAAARQHFGEFARMR